jgi:phosphatidylglycerophosphatase A
MLSFLLFRFFDITKIGLIKKIEKLPGGIGIMGDDIAAGICAFLVQCAIMTAFNQQLLIKVY